ncbi:isoprenylcysteine carboxylmethyltransferase family protein [Flammeovirga sp. EKP202]|uniref:methyltransferase family protein n=1 Tax=Flammeovirga sp. EKP202 TaxID=2770592 RepID=UPI00165FC0ED|nr:methyltransferase [Flammeovirga sp. EKP202]MBD0400554.1 hypothetical protein [Flammeovirga sp. EKP202]
MEIAIIRSISIVITFLFLGWLALKKKQEVKRNWAIFNSFIYVGTTLPLVNYLLVEQGFWNFVDENEIKMPYDLYFIWTVLWGIIPPLFLKKNDFKFISLVILWMDLLLMPELEKYGILKLQKHWIFGEIIMMVLVFFPAYFWSYIYYHQKWNGIRAVFQVLIVTFKIFIILPFLLYMYQLLPYPSYHWSSIQFQILFIIAFPAFMAVQDLVTKGHGTPFPYDPTKQLVRNGVYAYCRNPIQWSMTLIFLPLAYYHQSPIFLIGCIVSIAYVVGVSEFQEYDDMEQRFGSAWSNYIKEVPKWYFLWVPSSIPRGVIYFDRNCHQCSQVELWFQNKNCINLEIKSASTYPGQPLTKVTYVDSNGNVENGVNAIGQALEHIHLGYASLGWFMRFFPVSYLLQAIIDTMVFDRDEECEIKKKD